ncbi:hypothetical protein DIPPA_03137 [Diplonema papillatum]|nr:hypothetical protein DIPPA_03137 [Diplonema papillatum]
MPKTVTEEYLSSLKLVELRAVAAELGVEVRGLRSKAEVKARLIEKKEGAPLEDSDDESTGEDSEDGVGQAPETGASNPGAGAHLARGTEASEGLRAPPPLHPEPQWHTRPPFSEGELADPTEWLRDPWRAFEEAKRVWGPSTLRAASSKREVTRAFEVIRQLVPRIQDPAIQDTVAGLIRDECARPD